MQQAVAAGVMQMDRFSAEVKTGVEKVSGISEQFSTVIDKVQGLNQRFDQVNEGMQAQTSGATQIAENLVSLSDNSKAATTSSNQQWKCTVYVYVLHYCSMQALPMQRRCAEGAISASSSPPDPSYGGRDPLP